VHEKALEVGGEDANGEVDGSLRFGVYFAQPTGTESKRSKERKEKVRIAVTAQDKELSSEIDLRFGRAKWLIVVDTETGDCEAHDNIVNLNAVQGAGIQTGQNIANLGADVVITGNVGPNAFKTLNAAGVKIFLAEKEMVQEAIDLFKAGKLKEVDQASVEGHWI
jgi:predicted Fe-Mo cluster-binding NifX family protein